MCQINIENNTIPMVIINFSLVQPEGSMLVNGGGAYAEKMFIEKKYKDL